MSAELKVRDAAYYVRGIRSALVLKELGGGFPNGMMLRSASGLRALGWTDDQIVEAAKTEWDKLHVG